MEVSSHGIDQNRTDGLVFKGGIFTNLTHDHLIIMKVLKIIEIQKNNFLIH